MVNAPVTVTRSETSPGCVPSASGEFAASSGCRAPEAHLRAER